MDLLLCFSMSRFNTSSTNHWTLSFLVRIFVKHYFAIDSWVFPLASQLHMYMCLFPCWFYFLLVCCWKLQSLCPVVYLYLLVYNIFFSIVIFRKKILFDSSCGNHENAVLMSLLLTYISQGTFTNIKTKSIFFIGCHNWSYKYVWI